MTPDYEIERPAPRRRIRIKPVTTAFLCGVCFGGMLMILILASIPPSSF